MLRLVLVRLDSLKARLIPGALAALLAAAPIVAACSDQGEGERCDTRADNGGNDDCQSPGLVCVTASQLNGNPNSDRCCPVDRSQAVTAVCSLAQTPPGTDAAPPPAQEAGPGADASDDSEAAAASTNDGATNDGAGE